MAYPVWETKLLISCRASVKYLVTMLGGRVLGSSPRAETDLVRNWFVRRRFARGAAALRSGRLEDGGAGSQVP